MLKLIVAAATLLACFFALAAVVAVTGDELIDHSVQNSRAILSDFRTGARFVEAFRQRHGRLPSSVELETLTKDKLRYGIPLLIVSPEDGQAGGEAVAALGRPPEGEYFLGIWRSDWMEYYAPWSGRSTLSLEKSGYYMFGWGKLMDILINGLLALISITSAYLLWTRKRPAMRISRTFA